MDDQHDEQNPAAHAGDELEEAKIRRVTRERRAMMRTRGYYLVLMLACWVMAVQLTWMAVTAFRARGFGAGIPGYAAAAMALLVLGWEMRNRATATAQRIRQQALPEPSTPPDFTGLSDGSQHARNLGDTR